MAGKITNRIAAILTIACGIGAATGVLTYLASRSLPQALLAAGTAVGGAIQLLVQITGTGPERPISSQDKHTG